MCEHEHHHENSYVIPRIAAALILFACGFWFKPLFLVSYLLAGGDVLFKALRNIIKGQIFDENFLMGIATIGAICIKEYPEAVMVMILYQIGEYFQHRAVEKSRHSITELMDIRPDYANLNGEKVSPKSVKIGDIIAVKTGEKIPLDGVVIEGEASIDCSALTGESVPARVKSEDNVISGCINLDGVLQIKVTKEFGESTVSRILELVEHASSKKAKAENFITKFAKYYTPAVVVMAVIIAFKKPSEMTNDVAGALSFPSKWSFSNFTEAMKVTDFWHSLGNSLLITIVTIVLAILIHSIAGYVIGRGMARKKSFRFIYLYIVSGMFVPFSILMMPLVKQTAQMGLGNRAGVIILYLVFYMPMNVLLYSGYLKNIPMALEEAADIDGASTWTTYWRVVFPMMKPMHATVAILTALGTWNDVMTPLVIMSGTGQNTLPLAQLNFQTQFGTNYNLAFASYILALIPILIFYIICQKQILNGVANGAIKG